MKTAADNKTKIWKTGVRVRKGVAKTTRVTTRFTIIALMAGMAVATLVGCSGQPLSTREKGTLIGGGAGAATGAIIGAAVGAPGIGAAIGGGIGAVGGALIGNSMQNQETQQQQTQGQIQQQQQELEQQRQQIEQMKQQQQTE
jgi:hypothetical protein